MPTRALTVVLFIIGLATPVVAQDGGGTDVPLGGGKGTVIAINPLDPHNVVAASLDYPYTDPVHGSLRCSLDQGFTWTEDTSVLLPVEYDTGGWGHTLAFDVSGDLFWGYIAKVEGIWASDVLMMRIDPQTGALVSGPLYVTRAIPNGNNNLRHQDAMLAVDDHPGSPYHGRLYVAWQRWNSDGAGTVIRFKFSDDQGASWSSAVSLSPPPDLSNQGYVNRPRVAIARNGDVFVAYHSQPGFNLTGSGWGNPDGVSGQVIVRRSVDGGATFGATTMPFGQGEADTTWNVQDSPGAIPGAAFGTVGCTLSSVLVDPIDPTRVYVVASDDSDDLHGVGDEADIYLSVSEDSGQTWSDPQLVEAGPNDSFQVLPMAVIDRLTGALAVVWYDNRAGAVNPAGNFLLDVYTALSVDGGQSWSTIGPLNDVAFDPDLGAPVHAFFPGPPPTLDIGGLLGAALADTTLQAIWCGNTAVGQQAITDSIPGLAPASPWVDLGQALGGAAGEPSLVGYGPLLAEAPLALELARAAPLAPATLVMGVTSVDLPFKGGVMVPSPDRFLMGMVTDVAGRIEIAGTWPASLPPAMQVYLQWWVVDAAGPVGVSASNGIRGNVP